MLYLRRVSMCYLSVWTLIFIAGCGGGSTLPKLGQVTGVVTFSGKPVDGALVEFVPVDGRPSFGTTQSDGSYTLTYTPGNPGAVLGKHLVRISKDPQSGETGDGVKAEKKVDPIPMKYNAKSILEAEVKSGNNVHDFALET